jgi:hypothetical protein
MVPLFAALPGSMIGSHVIPAVTVAFAAMVAFVAANGQSRAKPETADQDCRQHCRPGLQWP